MTVKIGMAETMDRQETLRITAPDPEAGLGALGTERGNLPLESIEVRSAVVGLTVRTEVAQGFRNPYDVPLEATYIFPLPDRAAVTGLRMEAEDRVVEGVLEERGQARADYDRALAEGKRASIAEEERPGVFTMRVGNILPGERVVIRASLSGRLPFEDGEAVYRFPLVVAPRYIPGTPLPGGQVGEGTAPDTDAVPDASRISPPLLLPGFPNPVRLSVEVDVDPAGPALTGVRSSLHGVEIAAPDDASERRIVRLLPGHRVDRDFILRLGFGAADAVTTSLAVRPDQAAEPTRAENQTQTQAQTSAETQGPEGTFVLTVLPPTGLAARAASRDVVLLLDRSGSMGGWKMVAARRAAARIVDTLTSRDRFAVLAFDHTVHTPPSLPEGLVEASDRHRFRAVEHLASMQAGGGTELADPLLRAADLLADRPGDAPAEARDRVLILVTDGQVGNEDQILELLAPRLGTGVRVHTIGIDRAVNAAFLRRLARIGGGRCELVESEDRLDEAMANIHRRIAAPLVTGLRLDPAGLRLHPDSIEPARLPDLFSGAPLVISGRFDGPAAGGVRVRGTGADGKPWEQTVTAVPCADADLAAYWARGRIRDLEDRIAAGRGDASTERTILEASLRFGVLCRYTSFVAIDTRVVNQGGVLQRTTQPVDAPSGWNMPAESADMPRASGFGAPVVYAAASAPPSVSRAPKEAKRSAVPAPRHTGAILPPGAAPAPASAPRMPAGPPRLHLPNPGGPPSGMAAAFDELEVPDFLGFGEGPGEGAGESDGMSALPLPPATLRARAAAWVQRLRTEAAAPYDQRVALLRELAAELRQVTSAQADADSVATELRSELLTTLVDELELPLADQPELERRWQRAVTVLEEIAAAPQGSEAPEVAPTPRGVAFWKRRS